MIILIALQLISSSLYATNTFIQKHQNIHQHSHLHSNSNHSHKHSHPQVNTHISDFFIDSDKSDIFIALCTKESYREAKYFISNPTLKAPFRPPII